MITPQAKPAKNLQRPCVPVLAHRATNGIAAPRMLFLPLRSAALLAQVVAAQGGQFTSVFDSRVVYQLQDWTYARAGCSSGDAWPPLWSCLYAHPSANQVCCCWAAPCQLGAATQSLQLSSTRRSVVIMHACTPLCTSSCAGPPPYPPLCIHVQARSAVFPRGSEQQKGARVS